MPALVRRFLLFQAFLWWQGGFVFYAAVVVPVGTAQFSAFGQGLVTQRVTDWLAGLGLAWHLLLAWELWADPDPHRRRRRFRGGGWLVSLLVHLALLVVHDRMDGLIDDDNGELRDGRAFRRWHVAYLWGVTAQWLLALAQAWWAVAAWTAPRPTGPAVDPRPPAA